jgi:phospholipid/cholesterol/gamma-HCH transport system substrate-binding protein
VQTSIENRARLAFAGVVLLLAASGSAWYFVTIGHYATYQIRTHDVVSGLVKDAPVEFHGVEVGKVTEVVLTDPQSVRILLRIRKDVPVNEATVATITSRGLAARGFTGYVYVALENSGMGSRPLAALAGNAFPAIQTAPSRSANLDLAISEVGERVRVVADLLQSVFDQNTIASLKESVDNLQQVTRMLASNNEKLRGIIVDTQRASSELAPLLVSSKEAVTTLQRQTLPQMHQTLSDLDRVSDSLRGVAATSNETIRALQTQVLPQAYKALTNLDDLSGSLNGAAERITRDPSLLIRGARRVPGPGEAR